MWSKVFYQFISFTSRESFNKNYKEIRWQSFAPGDSSSDTNIPLMETCSSVCQVPGSHRKWEGIVFIHVLAFWLSQNVVQYF